MAETSPIAWAGDHLGRGVLAPLRRVVGQHDGRHRLYVDLARNANGPIVELAVGNGRVAIPVARATGRPLVGIDSSPAMLGQARANARAANVQLELREGDMRDLAVTEPAALIYCPFRALLHLPTWADRRRTFERVAASLQPGGRFAWNAFAFDHTVAASLDGRHQNEPVPHTNRYFVGDNRIDITLDTGAKSSLWWATRNEWLRAARCRRVRAGGSSTEASRKSHSPKTAANTSSSPGARSTSIRSRGAGRRRPRLPSSGLRRETAAVEEEMPRSARLSELPDSGPACGHGFLCEDVTPISHLRRPPS
mgnify:CR=1 FL=1